MSGDKDTDLDLIKNYNHTVKINLNGVKSDQQITDLIQNYTADHSNFEKNRNYISISHCHLSVDELVSEYLNGFPDNLYIRLKCYKGYQMERDMVNRITTIFENRIKPGIEIKAFDGLAKGHPDFMFDDLPGDCKSVLQDDWIPKDILPRKVFWQMQGYMKYSNTKKALVIYESRESGIIKSFWVEPNTEIQRQIDQKLAIVTAVIKKQ